MATAPNEAVRGRLERREHAIAPRRFLTASRDLIPAIVTSAAVLGAYLVFALAVPHGVAYPQGRIFGLLWFDGGWFYLIVGDGYIHIPGPQQPMAFYPGFPFLVRYLHDVVPFVPIPYEGVAMNCILDVAAMCLIDRTLASWGWGRTSRVATVAVLMTLPGAMFYVAFYSESLFIFGFALAIWAYQRPSRVLWAALAVLISSTARSIGVMLLIPLAVTLWRHRHQLGLARIGASVGIGVVGIALAPAILYMATGDILAYQHAQAAWNNRFSMMTLSQAKHTLVSALLFRPEGNVIPADLGLWEAVLAIPVFAYVLVRVARMRVLLIAAAAMFVVDFYDGAYVSQLRYLAVLLPLWMAVMSVLRGRRWARYAVPAAVVIGFLLNLYFLQRFVTGRPMV